MPSDDENDPDTSIDDKGDIGVVAVLMLTDEVAESIEICRLTELNLRLISPAIVLWSNAGFSSTVTNWSQDLIFSCLKHSSSSNSLRFIGPRAA